MMAECLRNQERFELDISAPEIAFQFFDSTRQLDFRVVEVVCEIAQAFRIKKANRLLLILQ
jgi:hypothetical protein